MKKKQRKILITSISIALILVLAFVITFFKGPDERYLHVFSNDEATCMGCFSNIGLTLQMYAMEYEGHLPAGKDTPLESLNIIFGKDQEVVAGNMASHDQRQEFWRYYRKHKKNPEHLSCYRYNEGLTEDAPRNSVLMYYYKPTKWAFRGRSSQVQGRAVLLLVGGVQFFPEKDFQKMQKATIDWIKKNKKNITRKNSRD